MGFATRRQYLLF